MAIKKKTYRIRMIFSLSNINADFLQLILCMFFSHYIMENPFYGGALFLFANIWTLYFQGNLRKIKPGGEGSLNIIMWVLLAASILAGLALVFMYPVSMKDFRANYVSFFVLLLTARDVMTYWLNKTYRFRAKRKRLYKALFYFLFLIPCVAVSFWLMDAPYVFIAIVGIIVTGWLSAYQSSTLISFGKYIERDNKDVLGNIFSYKVFSNMSLYSQVAFSLGIVMYICFISFIPGTFSLNTYLVMALWLTIILFSMELFTWFFNKRTWKPLLNINFLLIGVALWIIGSIKMYDSEAIMEGLLWTIMWGFGLACITAVTNSSNNDQRMVALLADKKISHRDLYFRNMTTQLIAVIFSNAVLLCAITVWTFIIPRFHGTHIPDLSRDIMIQLPVIFMLVSVFFAIKQPLDKRAKQKLANFSRGINQNEETRESLNERLVKKSKVRFGVKILAAIIRPFLHLKVVGKKNMVYKNFPSIFVCNHGIMYGPIAAIIYLPTYFRPWVDKKMVDRELCAGQLYNRPIRFIPLLPVKAKKWIAKVLSYPVTWAINSFNPIAVEKDNLRNIMSTFEDTVTVLTEGDNVLIFPEKPKRVKRKGKEDDFMMRQETKTVGRLYTGFANIGKIYYDRTGKTLHFYPIYASKQNHTFKIGNPTVFDPANDPREEKQRIARELHEKMLKLSLPEK